MAKGYKSNERKYVTMKCPRCESEDKYLEGSIGKCGQCGQRLAVLSSKPIAKEKEPKPKSSTKEEEFKSRVREILSGDGAKGVDTEE